MDSFIWEQSTNAPEWCVLHNKRLIVNSTISLVGISSTARYANPDLFSKGRWRLIETDFSHHYNNTLKLTRIDPSTEEEDEKYRRFVSQFWRPVTKPSKPAPRVNPETIKWWHCLSANDIQRMNWVQYGFGSYPLPSFFFLQYFSSNWKVVTLRITIPEQQRNTHLWY